MVPLSWKITGHLKVQITSSVVASYENVTVLSMVEVMIVAMWLVHLLSYFWILLLCIVYLSLRFWMHFLMIGSTL